MTDFAALEAAATAQWERMRRLAADIETIRIEHRTDDGAITVGVDGAGRLHDLRLTEQIARLSPAEFDRAVVTAAAAAVTRAMARRGELVADFNDRVNKQQQGEQ
ncbi:YbaB/EbfC family nucleoid-associated protein [Nocardia arizonensis]|uniref:YbaB/EbfC family nucleoid-associated protein n=1 Tax=Nocardia arizonensis TaxID=1141647 RepID=UPI0006D1E8DF|nr:YbaB/EbfC family nucleoid-associated protein [Nocardia arizonensis]